MIRQLLCASAFVAAGTFAAAQPHEHYAAGYRAVHLIDSSRHYRPGTSPGDSLFFRPLDVDIWYPAAPASPEHVLGYGYFLGTLEARANFYAATTQYQGMAGQYAKSFAEQIKCADSLSVLTMPSRSILNASFAPGRFPLIVYFSSFGSLPYENVSMLESLAEAGYVVVGIPSIGRFPGEMTMHFEDLIQQVRDALFECRIASRENLIDATRTGFLGYSWGGLAAAIASGQWPGTRAIVSLEGSEYHHFGQKGEEGAAQEDSLFRRIAATPEFRRRNTAVPYLRFESWLVPGPPAFDSVYDFGRSQKRKMILQVRDAHHEDFCSIGTIVRSAGHCADDGHYLAVAQLVQAWFDLELKNLPGFSAKLETATGEGTLRRIASPRKIR